MQLFNNSVHMSKTLPHFNRGQKTTPTISVAKRCSVSSDRDYAQAYWEPYIGSSSPAYDLTPSAPVSTEHRDLAMIMRRSEPIMLSLVLTAACQRAKWGCVNASKLTFTSLATRTATIPADERWSKSLLFLTTFKYGLLFKSYMYISAMRRARWPWCIKVVLLNKNLLDWWGAVINDLASTERNFLYLEVKHPNFWDCYWRIVS